MLSACRNETECSHQASGWYLVLDSNNSGPSWAVGFGDCSEGQRWLEDVHAQDLHTLQQDAKGARGSKYSVAIKSVGERVTSIVRRHRSMATSFISLVQSTAATNGSL